ncbi:MAG: sigma 54-interacting transcriptional regulator [Candidatus Babeliales bacterium]
MIWNYVETVISSYPFLLIAITLSFLLKLFIFSNTIKQLLHATSQFRLWLLLTIILSANMISDFTWITKLSTFLFIPTMDYRIMLTIVRIAWAFTIIQSQALALFLVALVTKQYKLTFHQKIYCTITTLWVLFQLGLIVTCFNNNTPAMRPKIELISQYGIIWYQFLLILPSLFLVFQKLRKKNLPQILKTQLRILVKALMIPYLVIEFIQANPFRIQIFSFEFLADSLAAVGASTILLTIVLLYCARKIMGLRFLNLNGHVQAKPNLQFANDFKIILEQFRQVTSIYELEHIVKHFFKDAFEIPISKIHLLFRNIESYPNQTDRSFRYFDTSDDRVETFLSMNAGNISTLIKKQPVLIYDEIDFSYFYNQSAEYHHLCNFLQAINADIFLPIYEQDTLLAYIIVEQQARTNKLYNNAEQDEMIVFGSYLGKIINLLKYRTLETFIEHEHILKKELYLKHQEISQYKESIRSFVRTNNQRKFGLLFYKDRRFTFGNQEAKKLVSINVNRHEGHPLTRALKQIAQQVEQYKMPQQSFAKDIHGNTLILSAVSHAQQNNVIIAIFYPEISDVIKQHVDFLKNPTEWDYLLYLQTNKSGQLINQLIPGAGETILNFKIALLKAALSNKAILLDAPEEDLTSIAELLQHISLRQTLYVLDLARAEQGIDIVIKLFGINPIFGKKRQQNTPLLEKLNKTGTLFIKAIDRLDSSCQDYLAEFIRYGSYRKFKGEQRFASDVHIICSSNKNLAKLAEEGKFSQALFQELKHTNLMVPSLITLPAEELSMLADGFSQQTTSLKDFENLLGLSNREKHKLVQNRPASFQELKARVQQLVIKKSQKHDIQEETYFDPAFEATDPDLIEAARLGKQALKDRRILTMLWEKFDKNQSRIASFLGVNRSSVHRRLKKYELE